MTEGEHTTRNPFILDEAESSSEEEDEEEEEEDEDNEEDMIEGTYR